MKDFKNFTINLLKVEHPFPEGSGDSLGFIHFLWGFGVIWVFGFSGEKKQTYNIKYA